jgi:hypothetical protein
MTGILPQVAAEGKLILRRRWQVSAVASGPAAPGRRAAGAVWAQFAAGAGRRAGPASPI